MSTFFERLANDSEFRSLLEVLYEVPDASDDEPKRIIKEKEQEL
tara:strand:+ start:45 stop:176 length:132 start_codon:yes stop_codon:yes gene_type:complete